jgi:cholesterol 24(S)-hydroxylase
MTDDFLTFFVAGQETTANTLAFCFIELGKSPTIVEKAREEIDRVLGERTSVSFQDVTELKYCSAIFKEALRLYPPISALPRIVENKMEINGFDIPQDTILVVYIHFVISILFEKLLKL